MVDEGLVRHKLSLLAEYIQDLKDVREVALAEFISNKRIRRYVERTLQIAIEACLDIGNHYIADQGWREADSYRDVFAVFRENGVFTDEQSAQFQKMAQFRNLLVHDYAKIEPEVLYAIIQRNTGDLEVFIQRIQVLLQKQR